MSNFSVKSNVKGQAQTLLSISAALDSCAYDVRSAQSALLRRNTSPYQVINAMNAAQASLSNISRKTKNYAHGLTNTVNTYTNTEREILGITGGIPGSGNLNLPGLSDIISSIFSTTDGTKSWFAKFINNELKTSGEVISGSTSKEGTWLGIDYSGILSGALLYGEAKIQNKANFKLKNDKGELDLKSFGLSSEASASGGVAKGEMEGRFGEYHGKLKGEFLTGAVKGETKLTFFDDGMFNPSLRAGVKAEGSVLKGSAEWGRGDDQFGNYTKASGDVLHAEAGAEAGIGYLGKDKDGKPRYGVMAKASAMASVAQGKISRGITLFGVDIDVGVKGYAGAVGAEVGGGITTSGAKVDLSGALDLGLGLEISVDWSDAKWIGEGIDSAVKWAGDATKTVGTWIGGAADSTGKFISGLFGG